VASVARVGLIGFSGNSQKTCFFPLFYTHFKNCRLLQPVTASRPVPVKARIHFRAGFTRLSWEKAVTPLGDDCVKWLMSVKFTRMLSCRNLKLNSRRRNMVAQIVIWLHASNRSLIHSANQPQQKRCMRCKCVTWLRYEYANFIVSLNRLSEWVEFNAPLDTI